MSRPGELQSFIFFRLQVDFMKLRLFALRDTSTNKLLPDVFFHEKKAAKVERNQRNAEGGQYVVTPGPDHRKNKA